MTTKDGMPSIALPERIGGLGPLSQNLWWSWQPQAEHLYRDLDPVLFETLEEDAVFFSEVLTRYTHMPHGKLPLPVLRDDDRERDPASRAAALARRVAVLHRLDA